MAPGVCEFGAHAPAIGLDLDEIHAAGEPIAVTATLREVDADVAGQGVWARLRPHGNEAIAPVDTRLERACFRGTLPGQTEGLYDLDVSAQHVPDPSAVRRASTAALDRSGSWPIYDNRSER